MWILTVVNAYIAYVFADDTKTLLVFMLVFAVFYVSLYAKLVRFETPNLLLK
jgi:hypothetical protein